MGLCMWSPQQIQRDINTINNLQEFKLKLKLKGAKLTSKAGDTISP